MKKLLIPVFALALLVSFNAQSQKRTQLKGPKAKNYKPWENKQEDNNLYVMMSLTDIKGPEAKNAKVWENDSESIVIDTESKPHGLKGPAAKNRKVWEAKSDDTPSKNVEEKVIAKE